MTIRVLPARFLALGLTAGLAIGFGGCNGQPDPNANTGFGDQKIPNEDPAVTALTKNPPKGGESPGGGAPSAIRGIMLKMSGRQGLSQQFVAEAKKESPDWTKIQGQTKEYKELAGSLASETPSRGSKESWTKFVESFVALTAALDSAAQAKDKAAFETANQQIAQSCKDCHTEHRSMLGAGKGAMMGGGGGPGGGGPGGGRGPGGGGRGPGGGGRGPGGGGGPGGPPPEQPK